MYKEVPKNPNKTKKRKVSKQTQTEAQYLDYPMPPSYQCFVILDRIQRNDVENIMHVAEILDDIVMIIDTMNSIVDMADMSSELIDN